MVKLHLAKPKSKLNCPVRVSDSSLTMKVLVILAFTFFTACSAETSMLDLVSKVFEQSVATVTQTAEGMIGPDLSRCISENTNCLSEAVTALQNQLASQVNLLSNQGQDEVNELVAKIKLSLTEINGPEFFPTNTGDFERTVDELRMKMISSFESMHLETLKTETYDEIEKLTAILHKILNDQPTQMGANIEGVKEKIDEYVNNFKNGMDSLIQSSQTQMSQMTEEILKPIGEELRASLPEMKAKLLAFLETFTKGSQ